MSLFKRLLGLGKSEDQIANLVERLFINSPDRIVVIDNDNDRHNAENYLFHGRNRDFILDHLPQLKLFMLDRFSANPDEVNAVGREDSVNAATIKLLAEGSHTKHLFNHFDQFRTIAGSIRNPLIIEAFTHGKDAKELLASSQEVASFIRGFNRKFVGNAVLTLSNAEDFKLIMSNAGEINAVLQECREMFRDYPALKDKTLPTDIDHFKNICTAMSQSDLDNIIKDIRRQLAASIKEATTPSSAASPIRIDDPYAAIELEWQRAADPEKPKPLVSARSLVSYRDLQNQPPQEEPKTEEPSKRDKPIVPNARGISDTVGRRKGGGADPSFTPGGQGGGRT